MSAVFAIGSLESVHREQPGRFPVRGPVTAVAVVLQTTLDEMQQRYKTIDGYFSQGLGLDAATIDKVRARLTEPADDAGHFGRALQAGVQPGATRRHIHYGVIKLLWI